MDIFQPLIVDFTDEQIAFCSELLGVSVDEFKSASEEDLDKLYDILCEIECDMDYSDDAEPTEKEQMASDLVTLMGNAIANEMGEACTKEDLS